MLNEKASIVCFEQFIEAFLTESSKSPALIAKSNKQGVGTCLYQKESLRSSSNKMSIVF